MVLLTLRFIASGSFLIVLSDYCGVSIATASRVVNRVSTGISKLSKKFKKMPDTHEEMRRTASQFYATAKFPKLIGAVDCTHIKKKITWWNGR